MLDITTFLPPFPAGSAVDNVSKRVMQSTTTCAHVMHVFEVRSTVAQSFAQVRSA